MKKFGRLVAVCTSLLIIYSCSKSDNLNPEPQFPDTPDTTQNPADTTQNPKDSTRHISPIDTVKEVPSTDPFTTYLIKTGQNYMVGNSYPQFIGSALKFEAILDSSCIYQNVNPANQADINKLYGFSDANTHHQTNSARVGWNWYEGKMRIHAYCYVNGVRNYRELGTVEVNTPFSASIEVLPGKYVFTLNGHKDTMDRGSMDPVAKGYKLFPYFGGDEPAPHDVYIRIKDK